MRIAPEKQGPELYAKIRGEAWTYAEDLAPETLLMEDGVSLLLGFLSQMFGETEVMTPGDELRTTRMRREVNEEARADPEDDDMSVYTNRADFDAAEEDVTDIPEEVLLEEKEANHEVMKLEQMLGRAEGRQKGARDTTGF